MSTTVIVTGAGRGIGRAVAERLAGAGWRVALVARSAGELDATADAIAAMGGVALAIPTDVTSQPAVGRMLERAEAELGPPGALVNIAGALGPFGQFHDLDLARLRAMVDANWWGTLHTCQAVLPGLIERGGGSIVNIAGYGAADPSPRLAAYGAIKAALVRFTESLAMEYKRAKVRANIIGPGLVETRLSTDIDSTAESGRFAAGMVKMARDKGVPASQAAELVAWLLGDQSAPLTGRFLTVHDDYAALAAQALEVNAGSGYTLRRVAG
jgi:NAD(P)-dependent dehydrogenase (short-subunit alcohol dehydrogenase family)